MAIEILQIIHPWLDDQDLGRILAATCETLRFRREERLYHSCSIEVSESNTLKTVENMGKVAKLRRRLDRAEI